MSARGDGADHLIPGRQPVREALRAGRAIHEVMIDSGVGGELTELAEAARSAGVRVRRCSRDELDAALRSRVRHQGVVARCPPFHHVPLEHLLDAALIVVCDGITDTRNLGAIARTAEQAGAAGLVLRERRAAGVTAATEKAAAGALSWLPVAAVTNISRALQTLSAAGLWTVGLDAGGRSLWEEPLLGERVAVVVGEEGTGLSRLVRERVDALVEIPMAGHLDSLNASTAVAVCLFEVRRRALLRLQGCTGS